MASGRQSAQQLDAEGTEGQPPKRSRRSSSQYADNGNPAAMMGRGDRGNGELGQHAGLPHHSSGLGQHGMQAMQPAQQETVKRGRGRPVGSKNKIAKAGNPLVPHVLVINHGEDIQTKLKELSRSYRRSMVVLAASGCLSMATLMQIGANGQPVSVPLRGHFTILSISGALLQAAANEMEGLSKRAMREPYAVFLSASLANPTGGVVGGTVAGPLESAGQVTLVIGHWDPDRGNNGLGDDQELMRLPSGTGAGSGQYGGGGVGQGGLVPGMPAGLAGMDMAASLEAQLMPQALGAGGHAGGVGGGGSHWGEGEDAGSGDG